MELLDTIDWTTALAVIAAVGGLLKAAAMLLAEFRRLRRSNVKRRIPAAR
jgi:hypothetical protein